MRRLNLAEELYMYENRPSSYNSDLHAHRIVSLLLHRGTIKELLNDEISLEENREFLD